MQAAKQNQIAVYALCDLLARYLMETVRPAAFPVLKLLEAITGRPMDGEKAPVDIEDYLYKDWVLSRRRHRDSFWSGSVVDGVLTLSHVEEDYTAGTVGLEIEATWRSIVISDSGLLPPDFTDSDLPTSIGNVVTLTILLPTATVGEESYPAVGVSYELSETKDCGVGEEFSVVVQALVEILEEAPKYGFRCASEELKGLADAMFPDG